MKSELMVLTSLVAVCEAVMAAWERSQTTLTEALYVQAHTAVLQYYDALRYGQHDTIGRVHPHRTEYEQDLEARLVYAQMRWCETADQLQAALAAVEGLEKKQKLGYWEHED